MGKNLKGNDSRFSTRYIDKAGKRYEKYFKTLLEARNWMEDAKYAVKYEGTFIVTETTVDKWFEFGIANIVGVFAHNMIRSYRKRYIRYMLPVMSKMFLFNVKLTP